MNYSIHGVLIQSNSRVCHMIPNGVFCIWSNEQPYSTSNGLNFVLSAEDKMILFPVALIWRWFISSQPVFSYPNPDLLHFQQYPIYLLFDTSHMHILKKDNDYADA